MQGASVAAILRKLRHAEGSGVDPGVLDRVIAEKPESSLERMDAIGETKSSMRSRMPLMLQSLHLTRIHAVWTIR